MASTNFTRERRKFGVARLWRTCTSPESAALVSDLSGLSRLTSVLTQFLPAKKVVFEKRSGKECSAEYVPTVRGLQVFWKPGNWHMSKDTCGQLMVNSMVVPGPMCSCPSEWNFKPLQTNIGGGSNAITTYTPPGGRTPPCTNFQCGNDEKDYKWGSAPFKDWKRRDLNDPMLGDAEYKLFYGPTFKFTNSGTTACNRWINLIAAGQTVESVFGSNYLMSASTPKQRINYAASALKIYLGSFNIIEQYRDIDATETASCCCRCPSSIPSKVTIPSPVYCQRPIDWDWVNAQQQKILALFFACSLLFASTLRAYAAVLAAAGCTTTNSETMAECQQPPGA